MNMQRYASWWPQKESTRRQYYVWIAMLAVWAALFGRTILDSVVLAFDPWTMSDDIRIVHFHFYRWKDAALFTNDVLGKYHSDGTSELFRGLFYLVAKFGDPYQFTKLAPYVLYLVTLVGVGVAANKLGGKVAVFAAVTLCLGSPFILGRTAGMLPRAFAYPIIAWMAVALVQGRTRTLACLTILGSGFYPVVTVIGGLALALVLLVLPARDRGSAARWSWKKRLGWLAATAVACALLTAPFTLRMRPYGRAITPDLVAHFPEAGLGGRHDAATRPPFAPLAQSFASSAEFSILGAGARIVPPLGRLVVEQKGWRRAMFRALSLLTAIGCLGLGFSGHRGVRRLTALAVATAIGYVVAGYMTPRLVVPPRYTTYGTPIVAILAVAAAPAGLLPRCWIRNAARRVRVKRVLVLAFTALVIGMFGGRGRSDIELRKFVQTKDLPALDFLSRLPKSSLIAGWPEGLIQTMPIVAKRTPFLTQELHVPYHTDITLEMRRRMLALIDGFYASDNAPLRRLREEYGVTHLLVETRWLREPSRYFAPFSTTIESAFARGVATGFAVERLRPLAQYDDGSRFLLDLGMLQ